MRLGYEPHIESVNSLIQLYKNSTNTLGFAVIFSHVRAICNHWCTRSRFGIKNALCSFGCGFVSDRISHTLVCPCFWQLFFAFTHFDHLDMCLDDIILLFSDDSQCSASFRLIVLLGTHISFLCFHACKNGRTLNKRLVQHYLTSYCRNHRHAARLLSDSFPST